MSFRSILSGYPKTLNVRSIYLQSSNTIIVRQANKKRNFWDWCMYLYPYNLLKLQNEYTRHVSISYDFLIHLVLSSKFSKLFHHIWFFSVCQRSFSWVHTIRHCNLTIPWPTLCHCWGYRINNLMLITACYSPLTEKLGPKHGPVKHLVRFELGSLKLSM